MNEKSKKDENHQTASKYTPPTRRILKIIKRETSYDLGLWENNLHKIVYVKPGEGVLILGAGSAWLFLKFTLATFRNKTGKKCPPPRSAIFVIFFVKRVAPYKNAQNEPKIANKGI